MRAFVNEALIERRARMARYAGFVGLGTLVGALFLIRSNLFLSYLLLGAGLISATVASYMTSQYIREPRADRVLQRALEGLDKRYALYSYYLPSSHIVISHHGLTVLLAKPQRGRITFDGQRWQHRASWRRVRQFFGEPGLGHPAEELQAEMQRMQKWLQKNLPNREIPISGAVVFIHPEVVLELSDPQVPVLTPRELPEFLRHGLDVPIISSTLQKELRQVLDNLTE